MADIATGLYLSERFFDLATEAQATSDLEDWTNASIAEDDELEEAGYAVGLSDDDECVEMLLDI